MNAQLNAPDELLALRAYAYSYPHKSAYRPLTPPVSIADAWQEEDVRQLSLYVHVPFCEMRCGFCNLFTQSQPAGEAVESYLATLLRQFSVVRRAVPEAEFAQFAIGGGTPTYLSAQQLERLLAAVESGFDLSIASLPTSIETSPLTATRDRLAILKEFGVERISIGVQSFETVDLQAFGRPRQCREVYAALETIRELEFPTLNIDLIYGTNSQTASAWQTSLTEAHRFKPEEIYLYPLYVRPDTGLDQIERQQDQHRHDLYQLAVEYLTSRGYQQTSLRCFRRSSFAARVAYTCQRDGMIGLGCGARSYTRRLHYATKFAVLQTGVRAILSEWIRQTDHELAHATHGLWLSSDEQRRRYLIMSLLQAEGLSLPDYQRQFDGSPLDDVPELEELRIRRWLDQSTQGMLRLTDLGLENSDLAGPLLYSAYVRDCLEEFARR
jgi:oxygen-independent coproporphyrinogen-3 oxidase